MSQVVIESFSSSLSGSQPLDEPVLERSLSASNKRVRVLSKSEEKMHNNFLEALRQHGLEPLKLPAIGLKKAPSPIYLACSAKSEKGPVRLSMEDAHIDLELPEGRLIGIFDGHGEQGRIAQQVAKLFTTDFLPTLEKKPDDIRQVFIDLCAKAQSEIKDPSGGTCALVVYFHSVSNRFYTATLGDSEMRIYRKVGDEIYSIPASLVRDWSSKKDEERFLAVVDHKQIQDIWLSLKNPKFRRFPPAIPNISLGGINTARSLGDLRMQWQGKSAVSRKPKVSMCQAANEEGVEERVVFACDGLWDFVDERQLIDTVLKPHWNDPELVNRIVDYAIHTAKSQDNVTVMVGTMHKEPLVDEQ